MNPISKKCVLCGNEIKEECYIVTKPDTDSYYVSTDKNLIGEPICKDEIGDDGFDDFDGAIILFNKYKGNNNFYFKKKIVANRYISHTVSKQELKEICNIVKNIELKQREDNKEYFEGAKYIGNLEKVMKTLDSTDGYSNDVSDAIKYIGETWNKKLYSVITDNSDMGKVELYVNKKDKNEFIDFVKKNIKNIDLFNI